MSLKQRIQEGLEGKYTGLSNGFSDINKYIFGVQRKCYTLIGGASGSYKTTILDFIILNALIDAEKQGIPIDIFYYSFEIDEITKKCNWTSQLVYMTYGKIIPPEKIKGLGSNRLTDEELAIVNTVIPDVERLFDKIRFTFEPINPTGIYNEIFRHCKEQGEFIYGDYTDENGVNQKKIQGFKPKDDRYVLIAIDHLYLCKKERNFNTKDNMDKMSEYLVLLRNIFGISAFILQQYNQGLSAVDRQKFKGVDLSPQQTDFKDTTNPYQDSDVAIGLMNAYKMGLDSSLGYKLDIFKDRFLMFKIIKNRLSKDNIAKGLIAHPESGRFVELPKAEEFTKDPSLYTKF
jgi:replicative DNA helicase